MGKPQRNKKLPPLRQIIGQVRLDVEGTPVTFGVLDCHHLTPVEGDPELVRGKRTCPACLDGEAPLQPPDLPPALPGMEWDIGVFGHFWDAYLLPLPPADAPPDHDTWYDLEDEPFNIRVPLEASFLEPEDAAAMVAEAFYAKYYGSVAECRQCLADAGLAQMYAQQTGADVPEGSALLRPEAASLQAWFESLREPWREQEDDEASAVEESAAILAAEPQDSAVATQPEA